MYVVIDLNSFRFNDLPSVWFFKTEDEANNFVNWLVETSDGEGNFVVRKAIQGRNYE